MKIENPKQFLLAGKATANFTSARTGAKLTFSIDRSKDGRLFFVNRRKAPGAGSIGMIWTRDLQFQRSSKCTDQLTANIFRWIWRHLDHEDLTIEHTGRCGMCRRELTDEVSIARGLGPICAKRMGTHYA